MAKVITNLNVARTKYSVNRAGLEEGIFQPLYDRQAWGAAGVGSAVYTFFQTPVGGVRGGVNLTEEDVNIESQGQLPAGKSFLLYGIEVYFISGLKIVQGALATNALVNILDDLHALYGKGLLRLFINSKDYLKDGPIGIFPPNWRLAGMTALAAHGDAAATDEIASYGQFSGVPYEVSPVFIPSLMNFRVTLEFPTSGAITLPSANATSKIGVRLLGNLYRVSQ